MFLGLLPHQWRFIGIVGTVLLVALGGLAHVFWQTAKVMNRIHDVKAKADAATTLDEVQTAWDELQIVGAECWHRSMSSFANEVAATLRAKYQILGLKTGNNSPV